MSVFLGDGVLRLGASIGECLSRGQSAEMGGRHWRLYD